ncbi:hypothetical protein ABZ671_20155 [Micromonospora sp. NPDC006766]|uniref:hypothetical protein n=1 Tax=Micromonospora sp. NPDC006766 TaxID=3154778 RepID=UPI0033C264C5
MVRTDFLIDQPVRSSIHVLTARAAKTIVVVVVVARTFVVAPVAAATGASRPNKRKGPHLALLWMTN